MTTRTAERIAEAMNRKGLSAGMLAVKCGISKRIINYYLVGRSEPGGYNLQQLCRALDVSADWLIGMEHKEEETHD